MDARRNDDTRLAEEAASWLVRMEEDDSLACRTELVAWAKVSPRHVEELLFAQAIWSEFARIDPSRRIDLRELPIANEESVVPLNAPLSAHQERVRAVSRWTIVTALVIGVIAWAWLTLTGTPSQPYATNRGDQKAIKLSDGSVMHLNTESLVRVRYSDDIRQVQLLSGEALFMVEHDRARPFSVITDDTTIRAIGTQFNVRRKATVTRVSVVDGAVETEGVVLAAGEEAEVSRGQVAKVAVPDVQRALAWRERQLVFSASSLEEVAAEFNRYNRVQIRLVGEQVRTRPISGVFDADDVQLLLDLLAEDRMLEITRTAEEILIRPRGGG